MDKSPHTTLFLPHAITGRRCRVLPPPAFKPAVSVPLRAMRKQLEGKWHDQIVLDRLTEGIRYLSPHERIVVKRKKRKFSKSCLKRKEPTTMMRS